MVLLRILHPVQTFINKTPHSTTEIKRKKEVVEDSLNDIRTKSDSFLVNFQKLYNDTLYSLIKDLKEFVNNPKAIHSICIWGRDDIPADEYGDSWPIIDNRLDILVEQRVTDVLAEWENDTKSTRLAQEQMYSFTETYTKKLTEEMEEVEKTIRGSMSNVGLTKELRTSARASIEDRISKEAVTDKEELFKDFRLLISEKMNFAPQQKSSFGMVMDALLLGPHFLWDPKNRKENLSQDMMKHYKENKVAVVTKKAETVYQQLQHGDVIRDLVSAQLEPFMAYANEMCEKVPKLVKANTALLNDVTKENKLKRKPGTTYTLIEGALLPLLEKLIKFSYKSIKEYTISSSDVLMQAHTRVRSGTSSIDERIVSAEELTGGLFAEFNLGQFIRNHRGTSASIKTYSPKRQELEKFVEEKNIRFGII